MKVVGLLLLSTLLILSFAEQKGTDIQNMLAKERSTFIILFYDPKADLPNNGKEGAVAEIQEKILSKQDEFRDYKFFTLDATDFDARDLVDQAHVDVEKLKHHPVVAAA